MFTCHGFAGWPRGRRARPPGFVAPPHGLSVSQFHKITIDRPDGTSVHYGEPHLRGIYADVTDTRSFDIAPSTSVKPETVGYRFRSTRGDEMRAAATSIRCGGGASTRANTARGGYCAVGIAAGLARTDYRIPRARRPTASFDHRTSSKYEVRRVRDM